MYFSSYGLSGTLPSTPQVSGTVTVQHDDTPAFWAAQTFANANPNTEIDVPAGTYNVHAGTSTGGGISVFRLQSGMKNLKWSFKGGSYVRLYNDRASVNSNFFLSTGAILDQSASVNAAAGDALLDPVPAGTQVVTLQTPSQASRYPKGTYVYIITNTTHAYPYSFYAEVNRVDVPDPTTGNLQLAYPTAKQYSATLTGIYAQCPSCAGAPYILPMSGGIAFQNVVVEGLTFRGAGMFANIENFDGFTLRNSDITTQSFLEGGFARHGYILDNHVVEDSYANAGPTGLIMGAGAGTDMIATGNTYTASHYIVTTEQTCTEGAANIVLSNNTMRWVGWGQNANGFSSNITAPISGVAPCNNFKVTGNNLSAFGTNMVQLVSINPGQISGVTVTGNDWLTDGIGGTSPANSLQKNGFAPSATPGVNIYENPGGTGTENGVALPQFRTGTFTSASNTLDLSGSYGRYTTFYVPLGENITVIHPTNDFVPGYLFAIEFVQPASGGPYTIPAACDRFKYWTTNVPNGGTGINCIGGIPPSVNPAAGASTLVWFYDDGSGIYEVGTNYGTGAANAATASALATNGTGNQVWGMDAGGTTQGWQSAMAAGISTNGTANQVWGMNPSGTAQGWVTPAGVGGGGATPYNTLVEMMFPVGAGGFSGLTNCSGSTVGYYGATGSNPILNAYTSATTSGISCAGAASQSGGTGNGNWRIANQPHLQFSFKLPNSGDLSSVRVWLGLVSTSCTLANIQAGSPPTCGGYAVLRYDTGNNDTTYKFCTDTNTGAPNCVDTGITASTAFRFADLNFAPSNASATLCLSTALPVTSGTCVTSSSKVPTTGTFWDAYVNTTLAAAATHLYLGPIVGACQTANCY